MNLIRLRHFTQLTCVVAILVGTCSGTAQAQWWRPKATQGGRATPCVLDKCVDPAVPAPPQAAPGDPASGPVDGGLENARRAPRPRYGGNGGGDGGTPGNFDFYVLSLSWSSGFCETTGDGKGKSQCDLGSGVGFVVHGLWPQFEHGFPSNCGSAGEPSRIALDQVKGLFPDEGLARYEWGKHGTCSGKSPQAYFADVRRAAEKIDVPDAYFHPTNELTIAPVDLARAFIATNDGLRLDAIAVGCTRQTLQEVRICFSKDLRDFHACPEVTRNACRSRSIRIPPVR